MTSLCILHKVYKYHLNANLLNIINHDASYSSLRANSGYVVVPNSRDKRDDYKVHRDHRT